MAKTKQDFYNEGIKSARMVGGRSPGNESKMPVFGEGDSWQAKAFAEGFNAELIAMRAAMCDSVRIVKDSMGRWYGSTLAGNVVYANIKRKTHIRKLAAKAGYKIL